MNLKHVKSVEDDGKDHFIVDHAHHGKFKVAKKGLDKSTKGEIQKLAKGGEAKADSVPGYADGGGVSDFLSGLRVPDMGIGNPLEGLKNAIGQSAASQFPGANDPAPTAQQAQSAQAPATEAAPPAAPPPPATMPPPAPPAKAAPSGGGVSDLERQIVAAGKAKGEGEDEQARVAAQAGAEKAALAADQAQQIKELSAKRDAQFQAYQQRADQVAQGIANGDIDPNRYWTRKSGAEKAGNIIGMILGGLGSGLSGQPNMAVQLLEREQDRDIEAQKANLGKQQTLLSHYVQQGHSVQEAAQLARADMRDYAAAMMEASASKFAGPEAMALAQQHKADTAMDTAKTRSAMRAQAQESDLRRMEIEQKRMELGFALNARPVQMAAEAGQAVPDAAGMVLDPKRRVKVPGGWALANTEKDRDEIADLHQHYAALNGALSQFESLSGKTGLGGNDTKLGAQALGDVQRELAAMYGYSRAPQGDLEKQFEAGMSNPTDIFKSSASIKAQADMARSIANKHMIAAHGARLVGGTRAAAGMYGGQGG